MGRRTRSKPQGGLIASVEPGSIAARLDLHVGDRLLAVNGRVLRDLIDYRYEIAEAYVSLKIQRGEEVLYKRTEKEIDQDLGLGFELAVFDNIIECHNRCSFCFIHQMAKGMRKSLYIMDDDFRLSFLQGNFVTLTNMQPRDWKRVYQDHLSPLNVSVHATNPEKRVQMVKHPEAGEIMRHLRRLARNGIDFNAQIVFCPGFNDREELDRTLSDLLKLVPSLLSIAIVPVGLSQFRTYLDKLTPVSKDDARYAIKQIKTWQKRFKAVADGDPIVRLADEFYLIAEEPIPTNGHYGDYHQLGDGVGMAALMHHEFKKLAKKLPTAIAKKRRVTVVTGKAGEQVVVPLARRLDQIENLEVTVRAIPSEHWGPMITVTGLLTFDDIVKALKGQDLGDEVVFSDVMLKPMTDLTLDGKRVADFSEALGVKVRAVENSARGLVYGALGETAGAWTQDRVYANPYEPSIPDFH